MENLPRKQPKSRVYLSHVQVAALAGAAGKHRTLVLLLSYSGLRWGEAVGLRVKHLDLLRKRLTVTDNAVQVNNTIHVGTPKSHKHRTVPVPGFVVVELAKQCEGKGATIWCSPARTANTCGARSARRDGSLQR